jgi:hypothetical protein
MRPGPTHILHTGGAGWLVDREEEVVGKGGGGAAPFTEWGGEEARRTRGGREVAARRRPGGGGMWDVPREEKEARLGAVCETNETE